MSILTQLLAPKPTQPTVSPTVPGVEPPPQSSPDQAALAAMMGAVQMPEASRTPLPQTTFPEAPRAMNPAFSQMLIQAMMGANGQAPQASLGSLLRGM